ncbi:hypothetical protein BC834DRAFT_888141 [Gloeopeniophorella convolvens]|nr:hypothetical protein BC834DRAFT_888141 [Gloeopeniophorella convolvens]
MPPRPMTHSKRCQARSRTGTCCSSAQSTCATPTADGPRPASSLNKNLVQRTAFPWTILLPSGLVDEPGTGHLHIRRTHITALISIGRTLCLTLPLPLRSSSSGRTLRVLR